MSDAKFISCPIETVLYQKHTIRNPRVNINLIYSIDIGRCNWYPDNDGIPTIVFYGETREEKWVYSIDQENIRDEHFMLLTNNDFDKFIQ